MVKVIPQGYGKCKSDNDRHQSNYPRVFPRDITTGDGAQAETQPHIFEELPGPCVNGNDKCTDFGNRECSDFGNNNAPISVTTIHNCVFRSIATHGFQS